MNERIKQIAEEFAMHTETMSGIVTDYVFDLEDLERFAELVRQDERNKKWTQKQWTDYELAIAADEREACAKLCDVRSHRDNDMGAILARLIRARGNT